MVHRGNFQVMIVISGLQNKQTLISHLTGNPKIEKIKLKASRGRHHKHRAKPYENEVT
jgi:hypothetical protein